MNRYNLTDKYEELEDDFLFPKTDKFEEWKKHTDNSVKLLSMLVSCISWDIAECFELDDRLFDALENEYQYAGYTFTKEEVAEAIENLVEQGYLEKI